MVKFVGAEQSGKNIRSLRGKEPCSELAKTLGISESALRMYECGARVPKDETKAAIAEHFGVTVDSIFFK